MLILSFSFSSFPSLLVPLCKTLGIAFNIFVRYAHRTPHTTAKQVKLKIPTSIGRKPKPSTETRCDTYKRKRQDATKKTKIFFNTAESTKKGWIRLQQRQNRFRFSNYLLRRFSNYLLRGLKLVQYMKQKPNRWVVLPFL